MFTESVRHAREGHFEELGDLWRHEGLKHMTEIGLDYGGRSEALSWLLTKAAGGEADDPLLKTDIAGIELTGPVGIAAGWDKTGNALLGWQALGAHHSTVGGVTYHPQAGLPTVRLRTMDKQAGDHGTQVSLNAAGFNSPGAPAVVRNIDRQKATGRLKIPVFVQVTANKELYTPDRKHEIAGIIGKTISMVAPVADGISLGLTSPNTLGMRTAQDEWDFIYPIVMAAREATPDNLPLSYKGDGDGGEARLDMYCRLAETGALQTIDLINSTTLTEIKEKYGAQDLPGGLAGADSDYQDMALDSVRYVYENVGRLVDIMGMGGVNSGDRAYKLLEAGASAIGINTAVRQLGARAVTSIEARLHELLDYGGSPHNVRDLVGDATERGAKKYSASGNL
jgi:dihydroorotate dehydrogenase